MIPNRDANAADELAQAFVQALEGLAKPVSQTGAEPEAIIEARIRANVLEIVRKMLVTYHEAVWHGRGRPDLLGLDDALEPAARVATAWTGFVATLQAERGGASRRRRALRGAKRKRGKAACSFAPCAMPPRSGSASRKAGGRRWRALSAEPRLQGPGGRLAPSDPGGDSRGAALTVEVLAERLKLSPSTVSFHLKKLEAAGLVTSEREQYYVVYRAVTEVLGQPLRDFVAVDARDARTQGSREEAYRKKVLDTFFAYGKLKSIPVQRKKRRIVLEQLVQSFEHDRGLPRAGCQLGHRGLSRRFLHPSSRADPGEAHDARERDLPARLARRALRRTQRRTAVLQRRGFLPSPVDDLQPSSRRPVCSTTRLALVEASRLPRAQVEARRSG